MSPNKIKNHYFSLVFIFLTRKENVIDADNLPAVTDFNEVTQLQYSYIFIFVTQVLNIMFSMSHQ